jgi:hypothetical protein
VPVPAISVVIPTHNRRDLLALTLRSALWQRDIDLEVIVVDDGSTDGSADMVAGVRDERVRVLRNDVARGVSAARNRGIDAVRSDWVAFLDDDDLWAADKLAAQLAAAERGERLWAYVGAVTIAEDNGVIGGIRPPPPERIVDLIGRYNAIPGGGSNVVVSSTALERVGGFDTSLYNTEDWDMWIRLARMGPPAWVGRPLLAYRVHRTNASLKIDQILAGIATIERRHGTSVDRGIVYRWLAESCLRAGARTAALRYFALSALRGQALNVAADLSAIASRRGRRVMGTNRKEVASAARDPSWTAPARRWLGELMER